MKRTTKVAALAMVTTLCICLSGCMGYIKKNDGRADLSWYMGISGEEDDALPPTSEHGEVAALVLDDEYANGYAIASEDQIFIDVDAINDGMVDRFYVDKDAQKLLYTNHENVYSMEFDKTVISSNNDEDFNFITCFYENDKCFVNALVIKKFVDVDINYYEAKDDAPARVVVSCSEQPRAIYTVTEDTQMRTKGNYQNLIVADIAKGTGVIMVESGKTWDKVMIESGYIGYIPHKELKDTGTETKAYDLGNDKYTHTLLDKKVCMVWQQIYNQTANNNIKELIAKVKKVNVISPTWFAIDDVKGNITTYADYNYVETAHKNGMQVWALVNDFKDPEITKQVLHNTESRQKLVRSIVYYLTSYELDGINIDFEMISLDMAEDYEQFIRELSIECRKLSKVLSIDNYPSEGSEYYNRKLQYTVADYVITMGYDQNIASSKKPGSVATVTYTKNSIDFTVNETGGSDRVISAMPFYTRAWTRTPEDLGNDESGTLIMDSVNGNYYLKNEAIGMNVANDSVKKANATPAFDEDSGQDYVTYQSGDSTKMIWLENETSMKARLDLMDEYKCGGGAFWALGQETDDIWNLIEGYFD